MAEMEEIFLRAKHQTFSGLTEDAERKWTGPFCFIQAADPQLGLMKAWREGDCDGGGDEWAEEVELTKQTVEAVNRLRPRPRFMVLCGDLVHAMPVAERLTLREDGGKERKTETASIIITSFSRNTIQRRSGAGPEGRLKGDRSLHPARVCQREP
ncbi:Serine/threonine-protein phosphatase cpped1 [Ameca splendens]|uniref:Serine/threonine-protein phosphatase cpped1 n=1 Tax=Ameca splendens TaxID=208324 RepID=A0ABV0Z722_9TELE